MRFEDMPMAVARSGDSVAMVQAIDRLLMAGVDARRPTGNPHQIKVTPNLNFYPSTGRILFDSRPPLPERGIDAVIALLTGAPEIP